MRDPQMRLSLSFKGVTVWFGKDISEPLITFILFLGWSAYISHLLFEIMKVYQF
jgi:hypothetical protein